MDPVTHYDRHGDEIKVMEEAGEVKPRLSLKLDKYGLPLEPQPSDHKDDPLNWPWIQRIYIAFLISLLGFTAQLGSALINPAFVIMSKDLKITVEQASYCTTVFILFGGESARCIVPRPAEDGAFVKGLDIPKRKCYRRLIVKSGLLRKLSVIWRKRQSDVGLTPWNCTCPHFRRSSPAVERRSAQTLPSRALASALSAYQHCRVERREHIKVGRRGRHACGVCGLPCSTFTPSNMLFPRIAKPAQSRRQCDSTRWITSCVEITCRCVQDAVCSL